MVNGPYSRNCYSINNRLNLATHCESLLYLILSIKDLSLLFFYTQSIENVKIIFLWHIKKIAVDGQVKRISEEQTLHVLWVLNVVFLLTTTLEPSDWGQKTGCEEMKTEDEEDSQEIRKTTLSSGSKLLFICDATSAKRSLIAQSNLDSHFVSCTSVFMQTL